MAANLTTKLGQLVDVLTPDTTNTRIGVANASPTRTLDVTGTGAISTSLAIGGATIGSNALAVTGSSLFPGSTTITSAGLLGLGMTPVNILDITQSTNGGAVVKILNSNGGTGAYNQFYVSNGTNYATLTHTGTGWTTSGMTRQDGTWLTGDGAGGLSIFTGAAQPIYFGINSVEKARFDTSGSLLVGTTTSGGTGPQAGGLVTAGRFVTYNGTVGGLSLNTWVTIATLSASGGNSCWLVNFGCNVTTVLYSAAAIVQLDNGSAGSTTITTYGTAQIQMSGLNIQIRQTSSGGTLTGYFSITALW